MTIKNMFPHFDLNFDQNVLNEIEIADKRVASPFLNTFP